MSRIRTAIVSRIAGRLFLRRPRQIDDRIVFLGDGFTGNIAAYALHLATTAPQTEIAYLTRGPAPRALPVPARVLRPWRWSDLRVVARARAVISAQGPGSLRTWLRAPHRPIFIDVWHGVGFKSRVTSAHPDFRAYDAHFVSSPHVAEFYRTAGARPIVTGYARMDSLGTAGNPAVGSRLDQLLGATSGPLVLYAPTWASGGPTPHEIVRTLAQALDGAARVAWRPHLRSADAPDPRVGHVIDHATIAHTSDLLPSVDVLITDWSSIATDYLPLGRPVIYLDVPPPAAHLGPLTAEDRPGPIVTTIDSLVEAVRVALADPEAAIAPFAAARSATVERAWGSTLDGHSSDRYDSALADLERHP